MIYLRIYFMIYLKWLKFLKKLIFHINIKISTNKKKHRKLKSFRNFFKMLAKVGIEGTFLNRVKDIYQKPIKDTFND